VLRGTRKVSNDHLISWKRTKYEVPTGLARTKIEVFHHVIDDTIRVFHQGRFIRLSPVDRNANALSRRGEKVAETDNNAALHTEPRPSAADLSFRRDFGPIVGPDGGFSDSDSDKEMP